MCGREEEEKRKKLRRKSKRFENVQRRKKEEGRKETTSNTECLGGRKGRSGTGRRGGKSENQTGKERVGPDDVMIRPFLTWRGDTS